MSAATRSNNVNGKKVNLERQIQSDKTRRKEEMKFLVTKMKEMSSDGLKASDSLSPQLLR